MADVPPSPLASALQDRYRLERELGAGGMATVYLAHDLRHDRKVALKVLRPELAAVIGAERFLAEIKTTANLQHPHILPLFDSGRVDGSVFYVMPFVQGESLRDRLARERQLPIGEAVRIAREVADALSAAHAAGIIHRDIKPENILLQGEHALVADFGIALAAIRADGTGRMTETGMSLGTPHYMSPEQALGERTLDARTDVYALGCVLYEMLVGDPPFTGGTAQAVQAKVMTERPTAPRVVRDTIPAGLEAATLKALAKLPADRHGSAAIFAAALTAPALESATASATLGSKAWIRSLLPWLVAAVGITAALLLPRGNIEQPRAVFATLEPPPGHEFAPFHSFGALSPDGQRFAFVTLSGEGNRQLWVRDLSRATADSLPETIGAESPFWSPDGRSIAFFARGKLWRLDLDGSVPRAIGDVPIPVAGAWGSQGDIVISFGPSGFTMLAIGRADGSTWTRRSLDSLAAGQGWTPTFLPDGKRFLLASYSIGGPVYVGSTDRPDFKSVFQGMTDVQIIARDILVFTRNLADQGTTELFAQRFDPGRLILRGGPVRIGPVFAGNDVPSYAASASTLLYLRFKETAGVWLNPLEIDASRANVHPLTPSGHFYTLGVARRGRLVAFGGEHGISLYDRDRGVSQPLRRGTWLYPVWARNGDRLVALRSDDASFARCDLRMIDLASDRDTTLARSSEKCFAPTDWTSDGALVLLTAWPTTIGPGTEIWSYGVRDGALRRELALPADVSGGTVSPDGRWMAYTSNQTGGLQVFVRPFRRGGQAVRVSRGGGAGARWSRDGRFLYYITPDAWIMRVAVTGLPPVLGAAERVVRPPEFGRWFFQDAYQGALLVPPFDLTEDPNRFITMLGFDAPSAAAMVLDWQSLLDRAP